MPCGSQLPLWCATCWPAVFLEAVKICCARVRSPAADARERVCLSFGEHVRSSAQTLVNGCAYDSARAQCYAERVCISCGSRVCGAAYNFDRLRRWACLPLQEPKQMLCCSPAERNHFAPNPPQTRVRLVAWWLIQVNPSTGMGFLLENRVGLSDVRPQLLSWRRASSRAWLRQSRRGAPPLGRLLIVKLLCQQCPERRWLGKIGAKCPQYQLPRASVC